MTLSGMCQKNHVRICGKHQEKLFCNLRYYRVPIATYEQAMSMESRNDLHRAEEFLASIRVAQELDGFSELKSPSIDKEGIGTSKNPGLNLFPKPNHNRVKELRKILAEIFLEYRRISSSRSWSKQDLMRAALVQAKVHRLKEVNLLTELNDIQSLAKLDMALGEWISQNMDKGNLSREPAEEMKAVLSRLSELLQNAFRMFEQSMQNLDFPDPHKQMFRLEELEDELKKMPDGRKKLIEKLAPYQEKFQTDEWKVDGRLQPELLALDVIQDSEDSIGKLPHESIRDFIFQNGHFWERHETLYAERHEQLLSLIKNYYSEKKALQEALGLCKKGDYRKARKILNQSLGCFTELPYDLVGKEVNDLRIKALVPYRELIGMLPGEEAVSVEELTEREKDFGPIGEQKVKALARSIFNPLRLLLVKNKWLLKVRNYNKTSVMSLAAAEKLGICDLRSALLHRWDKGRNHATHLSKKIRKAFHSKILKNTMILGMNIICVLAGFNLYDYGKRLPKTNLEFKLEGLPLDSLILETRDQKIVRFSSFDELGKQQIRGLSPGKYTITANFINTFPLQIQKNIPLGKTTSLTKELTTRFHKIKETTLSIQAPIGSKIHITETDSDLGTVLRIEPQRIDSMKTRVDWLEFNMMNDRLLATSSDQNAALVQITNGKILGTFSMGDDPIERATFSPTGQYILTLGHQGAWALWNSQSGKNLCAVDELTSTIVCSAFRPDENTLLTLNANYKLQEWKVPTGELLNELILPNRTKSDQKWAMAQLHPSWKQELSHGLQMRMDTTPRIRASLHASTKDILLAVITSKNRLITWAGTSNEMKVHPMIIPNTRTLAFDPSGEYLVAAGLNGDILIANLKNQRIRTLIANKGNTADRFTFSKSGNLLATSSANQLQILSIPDGKPIQNLKATSIPPGPMALASDGACLAVAGEKEGILLWKNYSTSRTRLPPGEYKILVEKNGHQLLKENVILRAGNSITMEAHSNDTFPLAQMGTIQ